MRSDPSIKTPTQYLSSVPDDRKKDMKRLHVLIRKNAPKLKPNMNFGMIGYGVYSYKYASGRTGEWSVIAIASQKNYIALYICALDEKGRYLAEVYKTKLSKANIGKSCIRFRHLDDLDQKVVAQIIRKAAKFGGMSATKDGPTKSN